MLTFVKDDQRKQFYTRRVSFLRINSGILHARGLRSFVRFTPDSTKRVFVCAGASARIRRVLWGRSFGVADCSTDWKHRIIQILFVFLTGYLGEGHAPFAPQGPGAGDSRESDLDKPDGSGSHEIAKTRPLACT